LIKAKTLHRFVGKTNRIVEGTTIKGDIISQADFRLDGKLIGNFQSPEKNCPAGSVVGDIVCKNADIEGKFEGTIEVAELLSIKSKASIQGSVKVKLSVSQVPILVLRVP
jgi:cytoskeletal protein CcmA (bactofilin family)